MALDSGTILRTSLPILSTIKIPPMPSKGAPKSETPTAIFKLPVPSKSPIAGEEEPKPTDLSA